MKRIALIVPLALFAIFVIVAVLRMGTPQIRVVESQMVGKTVPDFSLEGLNNANPGLAASDLRQGTVTLVNLFASWCLPCRVEAPQLDRLQREGIVIHAIAIRDKPRDIEAFLTQYGDPFSRIGLDPGGRMQFELGASGVPETFLLDGSGTIRAQWIGELRAEQVEEVLREVEKWRK